MDITSLIGTLLSSDSISGVSKTTKSSSSDVASVLSAALPLLLNGAQAQAEDKNTAASFSKALASHGKDDTSDIASFLDKVDMEDGSKIIARAPTRELSREERFAMRNGHAVHLTFTGNVMYFFNPETGRNLIYG